jgi:hypothetical protein
MSKIEFDKIIKNLEQKRIWATGWLKTAIRNGASVEDEAYWKTIIADVDYAIAAETKSFSEKIKKD